MDYITLAIIGFFAGALGGLLGIGGSSIMIPGMVLIIGKTDSSGREMILQYQAAAMIVNMFIAIFSAHKHYKHRAIDISIWKLIAPSACIAICVGVLLARLPLFEGGGMKILRYLFAILMLYVAITNLLKIISKPKDTMEVMQEHQPSKGNLWGNLTIGGAFGISAGIMGIGGGSVAVPLLSTVNKLSLPRAIATSSALIASTAWLGAIVKNATLGEYGSVQTSLFLAGVLIPTAIIGGYLGAALTHKLPIKAVRAFFVVLMLLATFKMIQ